MTTPTTQREADERVRLPQPDTTYYAPFQGASLDQQMNAVMAVPDESLDDHLRSIGLDPAECEAAGQRALAGALDLGSAPAQQTERMQPSREAPKIKTWQERTGNHNIRPGSVKHMIAEIADLRAALARAPLPAQQAQAVDVARDAARYRWLREQPFHIWKRIAWNTWNDEPPVFRIRDEEIDAAMSRPNTTGGSDA